MQFSEETLSSKRVFTGQMINVDVLTVTLPNGETATRERVDHPGAAVIIPVDNDNYVYMVRQYRKPIDKVCLELPAGKLDKHESPNSCALRELKEETGLEAKTLKFITTIHSTPGFCNEVLHLYLATDLILGAPSPDQGELIDCHKYKLVNLINMIIIGKITDAKTIIGLFMLDKFIRDGILL